MASRQERKDNKRRQERAAQRQQKRDFAAMTDDEKRSIVLSRLRKHRDWFPSYEIHGDISGVSTQDEMTQFILSEIWKMKNTNGGFQS